MNKREVLETLVDRWEALVETYFSGCPQDEIITEALIALDKLEKEKTNGAYKSGYHDALNGRPYKVSDLQRGL